MSESLMPLLAQPLYFVLWVQGVHSLLPIPAAIPASLLPCNDGYLSLWSCKPKYTLLFSCSLLDDNVLSQKSK